MPIKNAFKVLIEIFHGDGTKLVEDAPNLDPIISVRVVPILGGYQQTVILLTEGAQLRSVVMEIT